VSAPLHHEFKCDCGYWVRCEDWETLDKIARTHERRCKQPSVARSQSTPFLTVIPEEA
jgi:hypothetical protein